MGSVNCQISAQSPPSASSAMAGKIREDFSCPKHTLTPLPKKSSPPLSQKSQPPPSHPKKTPPPPPSSPSFHSPTPSPPSHPKNKAPSPKKRYNLPSPSSLQKHTPHPTTKKNKKPNPSPLPLPRKEKKRTPPSLLPRKENKTNPVKQTQPITPKIQQTPPKHLPNNHPHFFKKKTPPLKKRLLHKTYLPTKNYLLSFLSKKKTFSSSSPPQKEPAPPPPTKKPASSPPSSQKRLSPKTTHSNKTYLLRQNPHLPKKKKRIAIRTPTWRLNHVRFRKEWAIISAMRGLAVLRDHDYRKYILRTSALFQRLRSIVYRLSDCSRFPPWQYQTHKDATCHDNHQPSSIVGSVVIDPRFINDSRRHSDFVRCCLSHPGQG